MYRNKIGHIVDSPRPISNGVKTTALVARKSHPGMGLGLFTETNLREGDFVAEYSGNRIPTSYADTLKTRYLFEVDQDWTVDGSGRKNGARYINHSCEPNCEAQIHDVYGNGGNIYIFAIKDIARGEEITIDYGDEYFDEFIKPAGCKCVRCAPTTLGRS